MEMSQILTICIGLIFWNGCVFLIYGHDKACAVAGRWRISETTLLQIAALGGTPGALMACHHFRHKTRKQPFAGLLFGICLLHIAAIGGAIGWQIA